MKAKIRIMEEAGKNKFSIFNVFRKNGFTLLEVLFALVIATIIVLLGIGQYNRYALKKDLVQISYNVALISEAANEYYHRNYKASETPPFNPPSDLKEEMQKAQLWPKLFLAGNKLVSSDADYDVSVEQLPSVDNVYDYKFTLTVRFSNVANLEVLDWYGKMLSAAKSDFAKKKLLWMHLPTYSIEKVDTSLWPSLPGLQQFTNYLSGRY